MYNIFNTNKIHEQILHLSVLDDASTPSQAEWLAKVMHFGPYNDFAIAVN